MSEGFALQEVHGPEVGKDFERFAYSPVPGQFGVLFMDLTVRRKAEEQSRRRASIMGDSFAQGPP